MLLPLTVKPGVDVQQTPLLAEAAWVSSNLIRFKDGMLQKLGGWAQLIAQQLVGTCRGMCSWEDFNSVQYLAMGTEQRLTAYTYGGLYDITPIQQTDNLSSALATVNGSNIISVTDASYQPNAGDWVSFLNPMYVNGVNLQGLYLVQSGGARLAGSRNPPQGIRRTVCGAARQGPEIILRARRKTSPHQPDAHGKLCGGHGNFGKLRLRCWPGI